MKVLARIFLLLTVAALAATACRRTLDEEPQLVIWLDIEAPAETKGGEGNVSAEGSENSIKDLRVWVFLHETVDEDHPAGKLLGYFALSNSTDPLTQYENRYHIALDRSVAQAKPKVDIYVIGNPKSVGQDGLSENSTPGTLDGLTMSGTRFGVGTNGKPVSTAVPSDGLPYTGVAKGLSMTGSYPVMRVDVVKVRKAVSKFRFVFCQLRDEVGPMIKDLTITGLTLNGENISDKEYLFNDSVNPYKLSGYRTSPINFDPPTSVRRYTAPEEYAFNPPTDPDEREAYARQYETLINDGINTKKVLTEAGRCYLRETDKQLSGTVSYSYQVGDATVNASADFSMRAPGDFVRGRSWIVYVYFLRDAMQFSVSWTGWENGNEWSLTPIDPMRPS
jgi:hypothetical protein